MTPTDLAAAATRTADTFATEFDLGDAHPVSPT